MVWPLHHQVYTILNRQGKSMTADRDGSLTAAAWWSHDDECAWQQCYDQSLSWGDVHIYNVYTLFIRIFGRG